MHVNFVFAGVLWGMASRAPADAAAPQLGSAIRSRPELAPSAGETHLWVVRVRGQRMFSSLLLTPCGFNCSKKTRARTHISSGFSQYLGSMLIKDLRGTESTQDACAKMRVGCSSVGPLWPYSAVQCSEEWAAHHWSILSRVRCLLPQRSTEQMRKVPTIILSITYKGVKFIDAANKVSLHSTVSI